MVSACEIFFELYSIELSYRICCSWSWNALKNSHSIRSSRPNLWAMVPLLCYPCPLTLTTSGRWESWSQPPYAHRRQTPSKEGIHNRTYIWKQTISSLNGICSLRDYIIPCLSVLTYFRLKIYFWLALEMTWSSDQTQVWYTDIFTVFRYLKI